MTPRRRFPIAILLLLLLTLAGGTAAVHFLGGSRGPRLGGAHRIERMPNPVPGGGFPFSSVHPEAVPGELAEIVHPAEVRVTVHGARGGAAVTGARVTLQDRSNTWTGVTDEGGVVLFSTAEAGAGRLHVAADGFSEGRQGANLREGETTRVDILLGEAPLLEGRVVSSLDGRPVPGASIRATPNPGMEVGDTDTPSAVSDDAGVFRLRAGALGQSLTLAIRAKGFVSGRKYLHLPSRMEDVVRQEFALDPAGVLGGIVRDPSGRPCPDAAVLAYPAGTDVRTREWESRKWSAAWGGPLSAVAGRDGRYSLDGLAGGGLYLVAASFPGFAPSEEREIYIPPGEPELQADFTLRACGGVLVKWSVGTRNNEGTGTATLLDPGTRVTVARGGGIGSCRFPEVAPGRYEVSVDAPNANRKGSAPVEVKVGETAIVEVAFTGTMEGDPILEATIEGIVTDAGGSPLPGVKVSAVAASHEGVEPLKLTRSGAVEVPGRGPVRVSSMAGSGEDGRFRIEGLQTGCAYRLLAIARDRFARQEEPVLAPASGIRVVLSGYGRLKGRLVVPAGAEPPRVMDFRVGGPVPEDALRSVASIPFASGEFDTGNLVTGPCRLSAIAGEYLLAPRAVEVRGGETVDLGDLPLVRGVMVSGRVVDSAGTPFPQVQVLFPDAFGSRAVCGEDGRFEAGPVPEGEWSVTLSVGGEVPVVRRIDLRQGSDVGDLLLPRNGTLLVRVARQDGRPWVGEVEVHGPGTNGRIVIRGRADHMGRFTMSLPAREYQVVIRDPAGSDRFLAEAPATVTEGAETKVNLRAGP